MQREDDENASAHPETGEGGVAELEKVVPAPVNMDETEPQVGRNNIWLYGGAAIVLGLVFLTGLILRYRSNIRKG